MIKREEKAVTQDPGTLEVQSPNYSQPRAEVHVSSSLSREALGLPRRDLTLTPGKVNERQKVKVF